MKKYIIGFLAGTLFATAATAFAEDIKSLIGREVQGEFSVTVQGKELEHKAIVIDGTSYAPVRAIGEAVGNTVEFDMEKGITLTKKEEPKVDTPKPSPAATPTPVENDGLPNTLEDIDSMLKSRVEVPLIVNKSALELSLKNNPDSSDIQIIRKTIADLEDLKAKLLAKREQLLKPSPTPAQ